MLLSGHLYAWPLYELYIVPLRRVYQAHFIIVEHNVHITYSSIGIDYRVLSRNALQPSSEKAFEINFRKIISDYEEWYKDATDRQPAL
jgi:hypothetical protein